jgi:hypothetical protein
MAEIEGEYEILNTEEQTIGKRAKSFCLMAAMEDADKIIRLCSENNISIYIGEIDKS